jgi:hypothetical protein
MGRDSIWVSMASGSGLIRFFMEIGHPLGRIGLVFGRYGTNVGEYSILMIAQLGAHGTAQLSLSGKLSGRVVSSCSLPQWARWWNIVADPGILPSFKRVEGDVVQHLFQNHATFNRLQEPFDSHDMNSPARGYFGLFSRGQFRNEVGGCVFFKVTAVVAAIGSDLVNDVGAFGFINVS